jgi:hypothetical protein
MAVTGLNATSRLAMQFRLSLRRLDAADRAAA